MNKPFSEYLGEFIIARAKVILIIFVIATFPAAFAAPLFKIDASTDTLLMKNNELFIKTEIMNKRFSPEEFILVAYEPKDAELFSEQSFNNIEKISAEFAQIERVSAVTNILNVPLLSIAKNLDPNLVPDDWSWQNKHYSYEKMQQVFTNHPLFTDLLVNQKQTATAMQIVFKPDQALTKIHHQIIDLQAKILNKKFTEEDENKVKALKKQAEPLEEKLKKIRQKEIAQIYKIIAPYKQDANLYLGGGYVVGQQLVAIVQDDLVLFGVVIALAICILLALLFQRVRWVVLPILCCTVSVLLTVGLFGLFDLRATVISSNFVALQLILTLAVVIHLIVEFRQISEKNPDDDQKTLLLKTFKHKFTPCWYAGITTSVGFASLVFSGIQPVVSFGWMMIIAMAISIIVSLLLFPCFLSLFTRQSENNGARITSNFINLVTKATLQHNKSIIFASVVLLIIAVTGLLKLNVENSFLNYFKESTQIRQELDFIDKEFGGSTSLDLVYTIPAAEKKPDLALSAQTVQNLQKIQHVINEYEATGNVTSVVNFTELAKIINQGKPLTEYELSVIYTLLNNDLKDKLLGAYYDQESGQLRISTRIKDSTEGFNRKDFLTSLEKDLAGLGLQQGQYSLTNLFVLYQDILQRLFSSQIMTLGLVFIALFIILLFIFKSIKIAIIAVIPNILTTLIILGMMGWLAIPLDLMTITISAIAMGIAVDDTIHFIHRYLEESENNNKQVATEKTFNSVGYALLYTTTIITIGFSLLSFSDFVPSIIFGLLTGLAMLVALLTDSTLLPVLLNKFVQNKNSEVKN